MYARKEYISLSTVLPRAFFSETGTHLHARGFGLQVPVAASRCCQHASYSRARARITSSSRWHYFVFCVEFYFRCSCNCYSKLQRFIFICYYCQHASYSGVTSSSKS